MQASSEEARSDRNLAIELRNLKTGVKARVWVKARVKARVRLRLGG